LATTSFNGAMLGNDVAYCGGREDISTLQTTRSGFDNPYPAAGDANTQNDLGTPVCGGAGQRHRSSPATMPM